MIFECLKSLVLSKRLTCVCYFRKSNAVWKVGVCLGLDDRPCRVTGERDEFCVGVTPQQIRSLVFVLQGHFRGVGEHFFVRSLLVGIFGIVP